MPKTTGAAHHLPCNAGDIVADRPPIIEAPINIPKGRRTQKLWHVPNAMIAEAISRIARPFRRKSVRQLARRKAHALTFQPRAIDPPDGDVLWMGSAKPRMPAERHQPVATQGKAAIADVMTIIELRPACPDIVVIEELRQPTRSIQDMPIPLDHEAMGGLHMIDHPGEQEVGIGG